MDFSKWNISPTTDTELSLAAKSGMPTVHKILYCLLIYESEKKKNAVTISVQITTTAQTKQAFHLKCSDLLF